jgi:large subunit ribosomal protein L9
MAIELILLQDVDGLGIVGEVVKVADGYARNYLLPHKKAAPVTEKTKARLAEARALREAELREEKQNAEIRAEGLRDKVIEIKVKTSGEGRLYGSVGEKEIADAGKAAKLGFDIKEVRLGAPIRQLGDYDVRLRLHPQVAVGIKVRVIADVEE